MVYWASVDLPWLHSSGKGSKSDIVRAIDIMHQHPAMCHKSNRSTDSVLDTYFMVMGMLLKDSTS